MGEMENDGMQNQKCRMMCGGGCVCVGGIPDEIKRGETDGGTANKDRIIE